MPISEAEWTSISTLVERLLGNRLGAHGYFITGNVIKRDAIRKLVWIKDLGDQAIPVVGLDYETKYYDTEGGVVAAKRTISQAMTPKIGETVLVGLEFGERSLPRCLGILKGQGWQAREEDD